MVWQWRFFIVSAKQKIEFMNKTNVEPADYPSWNRDMLIAEIKELVQSVYSGNHLEEILKEIIGYYIDRGEQKEFEFYINRYTEENDVFFVVPTVVGILARRDAGWKIYAYSLDHYNDATWSKDVPKKLRG
ncbi:hypothetical protein ANCDUO_08413 [Ancylostoma duodenale]|uniref:Uncharacterized protein n=1 Tax=Ancylostoma duodenale TaxID=51022 RepID=A0A0C2GQE0_9BILA|nr:hypothetical protein ANCDUO_08413 [Ancylostoma duodenale]